MKLSAAQEKFVEKWGRSRHWQSFRLYDLKGPEYTTARKLSEQGGYLVMDVMGEPTYPVYWHYQWTEKAKKELAGG